MIIALALIVTWFNWYVVPRDQLMKDTQDCVDKQVKDVSDRWRYQAEKEAWRECWSTASKEQDWIWSDVSRPRKQGEPQ